MAKIKKKSSHLQGGLKWLKDEGMPQMKLNDKRMTQMKLKQEDATNEIEMIKSLKLRCNEQLWVVNVMNNTMM